MISAELISFDAGGSAQLLGVNGRLSSDLQSGNTVTLNKPN